MTLYTKTIEAITFGELVQHGIEQCKSEGRDHNIINGMPWSFKYKGHPITHERDDCYLITTLEVTHHMTPDDMLITGVAGEIYPCNKHIFEATYSAVESAPSDGMTFGMAIEALKAGKRVARDGWNGKGMWLHLAENYPEVERKDFVFYDADGCESSYQALPWIGMKTADNKFVPWLASQTDMLAEDWQIVE